MGQTESNRNTTTLLPEPTDAYLSVSRMQSNCLEVQTAIQVDRSDNVPESGQSTVHFEFRAGFLLERGRQSTHDTARRRARCSSRGRGSHPSTVRSLSSQRLAGPVRRQILVRQVGSGRELASAAREGQGSRCSKCLGLRSVRRMGLNRLHAGQKSCDRT